MAKFLHWLAIAGVWWAQSAYALEITHADAQYKEHEYRVDLDLILNASPERVQAVLRDYVNYPALDASILEANVISRPAVATIMLYTKLRACSGLFCRTVKRVEQVHESAFELMAVVIPEQSEVVSGSTHTVLQTLNGRTRVRYQSSVVPKFWVPGFVGRPLMLRTLREASLDLFRHVEERAK